MLDPYDRQIVEQLKSRLREVLPGFDLRVFGSRARGDATPESDLDVFIETGCVSPALRQTISEIAWEVGFDAGYVISTFVVTSAQLESGPVGANPLVQHVITEGIPV